MLARCIGPRVLSAMLCVRFAQSMARHSTQVKQAFLYRVFWAVRWAMKPRGCSKTMTRAISSRRLTTHHISRSASTSMVSRFLTVWCIPKCGLARLLSSFCYRSMQRCAPTFQSACQSISCCMNATHWMCDACGESTRMTNIIESFPVNGPKPSELRLPAWMSTRIDRQRQCGAFFVHKISRKRPARGSWPGLSVSLFATGVLVERVEGFATEAEWRRAYREINEFERVLTDSGVRLIKLFLHITADEQVR